MSLNTRQIVIIGGYYGGQDLQDVLLFDTDSSKLSAIAIQNMPAIVPGTYRPIMVDRDTFVAAHDDFSSLYKLNLAKQSVEAIVDLPVVQTADSD